MRAVVDTSVIVSAVLEDAPAHDECLEAIGTSAGAAAGHAWFESVSVLTRLPPDLRLSTADACRAIEASVGGTRRLSAPEQAALQRWLGSAGIAGGAIYDALVGWVARSARVPLITRDQRALPTYRRLGIELLVLTPTLR